MNFAGNKRSRARKVFLVGAGPGDPELLTLRALRVIQSADVILHDALVSPEILRLAPVEARIENVGKRCGQGSTMQEEIHARMIDFARQGLNVVRLQGGDPMLFGRAGEEIAALVAAQVEFEIVPGVTAASAAAAAAGIALTDRRAAAQVTFVVGHREAGRPVEIPAPAPGGATIVMYMPVAAYEEIAERFHAAGWAAETPCMIVSRASAPDENILCATLDTLRDFERLPTPATLIVGDVVGLAAGDFVTGESGGDQGVAIASMV